MDAVIGQSLLGDETTDGAINHNCRAVVDLVLVQNRKPKRHDHAAGLRQKLLQHLPGALTQVGAKEIIFTVVAGDAQLRQTENRDAI